MKRLFLMSLTIALMTVASITTINAQSQPQRGGKPEMREQQERREKPTTEEMAAKITEKMSERIGLNEAQAEKVYQINLDYLKKVEEA